MVKYGFGVTEVMRVICCISRIKEQFELIFCMLIHSVRKKAKSYFGFGCDLLGPVILKSALY